MEFIYENNVVMTYAQHRSFQKGIPFYGQSGDFNFVMGKSQFTPGISIKLLPLADLSLNVEAGFSEFDMYINTLKKMFKPGDRVRGVKMNSMVKEDDDGKQVVGKFQDIKIDYSNKQIRAFLTNPSTLEKTEVYPDTMERLYENKSFRKVSSKNSVVLDFETFIST
tara:strand:- start:284 stop:781 length:498 start_codon:yes stop_codon:yes gene_type:complete